MRKCLATASMVMTLTISPLAQATSTDEALTTLDYPELNVVPRASERLNWEAQSERAAGWLGFWPFHISALSTILSGYALSGDYKEDMTSDERKDADLLTKAATGVGAGWIALTTYYVMTKPYGNRAEELKRIKGTDKRADLTRERLAEETLERSARLTRLFMWMSSLTNFAANAVLLDRSTPNNNIFPVVGMLASMLPFVFSNPYIDNYDKHLEYKRRIYAPVAAVGWRMNEATAKLSPEVVLQWTF